MNFNISDKGFIKNKCFLCYVNSYNDNRLSRVEISNICVMMFHEVEGYTIIFVNSEQEDNISNPPPPPSPTRFRQKL